MPVIKAKDVTVGDYLFCSIRAKSKTLEPYVRVTKIIHGDRVWIDTVSWSTVKHPEESVMVRDRIEEA